MRNTQADTNDNSCITISLLNMKGGVGKTTLSVNLAFYFVYFLCKRVLLIDLDPQFNASQWLMTADEWEKHKKMYGTIADILIEPYKNELNLNPKESKQSKKVDYRYRISNNFLVFDFIPSELILAKAVKNPYGVAYKLEKYLAPLKSNYDYIFIDCAPTDSILTDTALMASNFILSPVRPDKFSIYGYALIQETISTFKNAYHDPNNVQDLGIVFTQVSKDSSLENECIDEIKDIANYVFESRISHSPSHSRSIHEKAPIFATSYARKVPKNQMASLADEIRKRITELSE